MFRFAGPITMNDASAALAAACRAIDGGESQFSLDTLGRSDSSAVAVLIAAKRHAEQSGKSLRWTDVPEAVASLADLYGVDGLVSGAPGHAPAVGTVAVVPPVATRASP